nr:HAMP domain-containing sensor histidine kinase [Sphingomicrobium sediminis]
MAITGLPGRWDLRGEPKYDEESGHFLGYAGVAARAGKAANSAPAERPEQQILPPQDAQSLRELVHEIKTPLNAIIGFAEIIDGQYLGPAHRRYRERAAEIVAQARILLEAIKDLDYAARIQVGDGKKKRKPLGDIVAELRESLAARAARKGADLAITGDSAEATCDTDPDLAERLILRLVGALADAAEAGSSISIGFAKDEGHCLLVIDRPARLADYSTDQLFDPALIIGNDAKALLGLGFSLRLVRGLARVGGGDLVLEGNRFRLSLPRAA